MRQTYNSQPCFWVSLIFDHYGDSRLDAIEIEPVQPQSWSCLSRHCNRNFKWTSFRLAQYTMVAALCLAHYLNPIGIRSVFFFFRAGGCLLGIDRFWRLAIVFRSLGPGRVGRWRRVRGDGKVFRLLSRPIERRCAPWRLCRKRRSPLCSWRAGWWRGCFHRWWCGG